ncbi:GA-like domain-containing protein, partial [Gallibacterium anatis]|uniref:GA-like domain-containing protein n=4 Tax=Gallibacterium anatis TaxID=750 RepID=UPI0039FD25EB
MEAVVARDHPILGGVESTKITAAEEAVKAAEKAYQQAKELLEKAKEANPITAEENAALEEANKAIEDAKTKAEEALKNLPKDKEQEALKERLDAVNPIEIPENGGNPSTDPKQPAPTDPTDNQGNTGKDKPNVGGQDKDPALENAEKLVKAAEDAETKAEEALKEAKKDGVISQEEKDKLDSLNEEITKAKEDAENALKVLPEGEIKDNLKERLDDVDNIKVNDATDTSAAEAALAEAKQKAEAAKTAADNTDEDQDGIISGSEKAKVDAAIDAATQAKTDAINAINQLPDGSFKDGLLKEANALDIPVKENATDTSAAEAALAEAKQKATDAQQLKEKIELNGVVTATEKAQLDQAITAANEAKSLADQEIGKLPAGSYKTAKEGESASIVIPQPSSVTPIPTGKPEVTIVGDGNDADTVIDRDELGVGADGQLNPVTVEVSLTGMQNVKPGDKLSGVILLGRTPSYLGGDRSGYTLKESDITNGKVSFTVPVTDGFTGKLVVQGVKVQDAEKQSSATADRKEAALDLGADPTVGMSFRSDTGISGSDNITTNGELVLTAPQGYTIDRVVVNNAEVSLTGNSITLSEGTYTAGNIQVTVRNTTTGRIETVSNTTTYVVDTTAPDAPRINVESGRDSSISLPENAAIGDVVDVNITQPGKQQAIYVKYRKTDSDWEVATFQPADSGLSSAPAVSGNTITISQTVAPAGSTIAAKVTDLAGNGSAGKDGRDSFVEAEVPSSDSDNDGYTNEEESRAGSDPDQASSTPKTLAEAAYNKAKATYDAFEAKKAEFAKGGFTKEEVSKLEKLLFSLDDEKDKALADADYVHDNDGKADLIAKIKQLTDTVPEVTNDADSTWSNNRTVTYYDYRKDSSKNTERLTLDDLAKKDGGVFVIPASQLVIKDPDAESGYTPKLKPMKDWVHTLPGNTSVGFSEYRVDENGNLEIKIDAEKVKNISQTQNETYELTAEDGTPLTLYVFFEND